MRSYAGEMGQGPDSVGASDRISSEALHLFPPCVTPSVEPTFLPGISGGSFLPGAEQKAGKKGGGRTGNTDHTINTAVPAPFPHTPTPSTKHDP